MDSFHPNPIAGAARLIFLSIILTAIAFFAKNFIGNLFLAVIYIVWAVAIIKIVLLYFNAMFERVSLDDNAIKYTRGILSHKSMLIPYARVSEAAYAQTPFQRLFGVGALRVDSAGGSQIAIHMDNVKKNDLEKILSQLNKKTSKKGTG